MDPVIAARNEIEPLLTALIRQLNDEGRATPRAIFIHIHTSLTRARNELELVTPFNELSTSASVGFDLSSEASILLDRILEKAGRLSAVIADTPTVLH